MKKLVIDLGHGGSDSNINKLTERVNQIGGKYEKNIK